MLGVSLYGCEDFEESNLVFQRSLLSLRSEIRDQRASSSTKLHILHSFVKALNNIGCCSFHHGNHLRALKSFSSALGVVVELVNSGTVKEELLNDSLPVNLYQLSDLRTKCFEQLPSCFKCNVSTIFCNLAYVFGKANEFSLSAVYLNKSLKLEQQIPSHRPIFGLMIDTMDSLAFCLRKTDRVNAAIRIYKLILKTERQVFRNDLQYRRCMQNAGSFCQALQKVKTSSIEI